MRAAFVAIVVFVSVGFGIQPASAVELPVAGRFTGTAPLVYAAAECDFYNFLQSLAGTAELSTLGSSTVDIDFCVSSDPEVVIAPEGYFTFFTITGADGAIFGDVASGTFEPAIPIPLHLDLIVTGGTGAFDGATGTLAVDGTFYPMDAVNAQISGTIEVASPTPQSKAECKRGGWQNLGDDVGTPFRNQGECIRYVVHHS